MTSILNHRYPVPLDPANVSGVVQTPQHVLASLSESLPPFLIFFKFSSLVAALVAFHSSLQVTLTYTYLNVDMSGPPLGKQLKKSKLLRPFKGLFSRRSHSPSHQSDNTTLSISASPTNSSTSAPQVNLPSHQGAQSVTPHNATASISSSLTNNATSIPQASYQGFQSVTPHNGTASISASRTDNATYATQVSQSVIPLNATASISASPMNDATSAPRASHQGVQSVTPSNARASISASPTNNLMPQVNPQGTEYTAILELSTTPSAPLTWEHRMKEWGSTTYEGLKTAIQGIYDCSGMFPPLHTTAGVLLTISKIVDVRGSLCSSC